MLFTFELFTGISKPKWNKFIKNEVKCVLVKEYLFRVSEICLKQIHGVGVLVTGGSYNIQISVLEKLKR